MNDNDVDRMIAGTQVRLAYVYAAMFVGVFVLIVLFWEKLSKVDVGLISMFATNAMNQSKDAGTFFFARHRTPTAVDNGGNGNGGGDPGAPLVPSPPAKTT